MFAMQILDLPAELSKLPRDAVAWTELLRVASMSVGVYRLPPGATDGQQPHTEDEAYYVVSGRGAFRAGEADRAVAAGSLILVERELPHRFHSVTEELTVLVFFAPAEHSLKGPLG